MRLFHTCFTLMPLVSVACVGATAPVSAVPQRAGNTTTTAKLDKPPQPQEMREESLKGKTPLPLDQARKAKLSAFIDEAAAKLEVPGASVAVVVGGKVAYEKGFGVRALGTKDRVTPNTLFLIGSLTKSMTTMMQATLVDAGTVAWDTPVIRMLPQFTLGDPELTSKLVMWHMTCACTGMPQQDLETLFEYSNVSPEQRIASMATMKPTAGLGETYQYSNMMVVAGGYAAAHAWNPRLSLGDAYDAVMRTNIFAPIGMKSTTLDFAAVQAADHAMPHAEAIDGSTHTIPLEVEHMVTPIRPAGGVWSSAADMARYAITELTGGVSPDGKRVVSEANLLERRKPRIATGDGESYGLGLAVGTFRDLPMLVHAGGSFGFRTLMFMLPEQGIAIIVLTNTKATGGDFTDLVQRKVIEELFDETGDQARHMLERYVQERQERISKARESVRRGPDPAWLRALAGVYSHASLGKIEIRISGEVATLDAGEWKSAITQKTEADGTQKVVLTDPPLAGGELTVGGDRVHPTLTAQYGQHTYVFERVDQLRRAAGR